MNSQVLRGITVALALVVLVAGGLFTMYITEAGPFNDSNEPLACRNLSRSENVPTAKDDVLRRECEAAKAARQNRPENPDALGTPTPATPQPLVACDDWDPTSGVTGCVFYGVLEGRQPPPGYERTYRVSNQWAGDTVLVYAGSLYDDESQGVVVVMTRDLVSSTSSRLGEFRTEAKEGALRIVSAEGNVLNLITATGTEYTFDVSAMALTPS